MSEMETSTSSSERRSYLPVDTKGHCFLCLGRLEGLSIFRSHYPLQYLSKYLKMSMESLMGGKGPPPPSLSRMVVPLCEECASVNEDFSDLQQQLEQIELRIGNCLQRIQLKLEGAEETGSSKDFREGNLSWAEDVKFVLGLRQEVMEKCSQKLCGVLTNVQEESGAVKTRRRYAQKVIPIRTSHPENSEQPELEIREEDCIKTEVTDDYLTMDGDGDLDNLTTGFDDPGSPQSNVDSVELEDVQIADASDDDDDEADCDTGELKEVETKTKGLKVFPGGRKRYTITYQGFVFVHHSDRVDKNRITRCVRHQTGCRVRLYLNRSWTRLISKHSPSSHNHPPEEANVERRYAQWKLRSAAKASCAESTETIISTVLDGPPDLSQGPFRKMTSLKRYVQRALKSEQDRTGILPVPKPKPAKLSTLCEHCGRKFKLRGQLLTHVRSVHLKMREQQCDLCGKGFYDKRGLLRHRQAIHFGNGRGKGKKEAQETTGADPIIEALEIGHL